MGASDGKRGGINIPAAAWHRKTRPGGFNMAAAPRHPLPPPPGPETPKQNRRVIQEFLIVSWVQFG